MQDKYAWFTLAIHKYSMLKTQNISQSFIGMYIL